jgi:hypothetical protein
VSILDRNACIITTHFKELPCIAVNLIMEVSKLDTEEGSVKVVRVVERNARQSRIMRTITEFRITIALILNI